MAERMGAMRNLQVFTMKMYTTEYIDQDNGSTYAGEVIYAHDWETALKVLQIMKEDLLAPPTMVIIGERKSIRPTVV